MISKKIISHQYHQLSIARAEQRPLTAALRQSVLLQRLTFRGTSCSGDKLRGPIPAPRTLPPRPFTRERAEDFNFQLALL